MILHLIYEDISIDLAGQLEAKVKIIFLCTVGFRTIEGLGITMVLWKVGLDWIVQFDPPDDPLQCTGVHIFIGLAGQLLIMHRRIIIEGLSKDLIVIIMRLSRDYPRISNLDWIV